MKTRFHPCLAEESALGGKATQEQNLSALSVFSGVFVLALLVQVSYIRKAEQDR